MRTGKKYLIIHDGTLSAGKLLRYGLERAVRTGPALWFCRYSLHPCSRAMKACMPKPAPGVNTKHHSKKSGHC